MKLIRPFILLLLPVWVLSFASCEKEIYDTGTDSEDFPMFVNADVRLAGTNEMYTIDYRPSAVGDFFSNIGAIGTLSEGELGNTLILGLFDSPQADAGSQSPVFTLQFWPDGFTPGEAVTSSDLDDLFPSGRVYPFGQGPGNVDFRLALVPPGTRTGLSSSAYVDVSEGSLTVDNVFPFISRIPGLTSEERTFRLVRFSFSGTIGIFEFEDFVAAQLAGVTYVAKSVAEVSGEGNLVLEANWR